MKNFIKNYFFITLASTLIHVSHILATDCTAHFRQITGFDRTEYTFKSIYYPDIKVTQVEVFLIDTKKLVAEVVAEEKTFEKTPYGLISNLTVSANHKDMGIDTALTQYLLTINRQKKLECTLVVAKESQHDLYQRLGFTKFGTEDGNTTFRYQHAYRFLEHGFFRRIYKLLSLK